MSCTPTTLLAHAGIAWRRVLRVMQPDGTTPLDMTGGDVILRVLTAVGGTEVLAGSISTGHTSWPNGAAAGVVAIRLDDAETTTLATALPGRRGAWECVLVSAAGDAEELLAGGPVGVMLRGSAPASEPDMLVTVGIQGPPGPPGTSGAEAIAYTAAASVSGHRVTVLTASGLRHADTTNATHGAMLAGVSANAAAIGGSVTVQRSGVMTEPSWAFAADVPVWCGPDGTLTQTPPTDTAAWLALVGHAVAATQIHIDLRLVALT